MLTAMRISHSEVNSDLLPHCEIISIPLTLGLTPQGRMDYLWLKEELAKPGRSQSALARWLKVDPSSVNRIVGGTRKISADEAISIQDYLKVTERGLGSAQSQSQGGSTWTQRLNAAPPNLEFLTIRFRVQAGAWIDIDVYNDQGYGEGPVPSDPRIPGEYQWLEEVVGDSMNLMIKPGSLLHVIDAKWSNYTPRHGDVVVIERTRHQGGQIERSVKQIDTSSGKTEFWGRSTDERWNQPLRVGTGDRDGSVEVRIAGWVRHAILRLS